MSPTLRELFVFFVAADYHILILLVCVYVRRHVFLGAYICVAFF